MNNYPLDTYNNIAINNTTYPLKYVSLAIPNMAETYLYY